MISSEVLRHYLFFSRLTDRCLKALALLADERVYAEGVMLFEAGQPAGAFYFLTEGGIDLYYRVVDDADPELCQDFLLGHVPPGEPFGISALIEPYCYTATALVTCPSRALKIGSVGLRTLFEVDAGLSAMFMHGIARVAMARLHATSIQLAAARI